MKTLTQAKFVSLSNKYSVKKRNGIPPIIPKAQTSASACMFTTLHRRATSAPIVTPKTPATKVTIPNL